MTKVLYVEDNDDNVFMLKIRLELLGDFEVLTAEDGEKGCAMAVSECPDIILMDLEMPVVDGWEARPAPGRRCPPPDGRKESGERQVEFGGMNLRFVSA